MCEAHAYLRKGGKEEIVMESVDVLRPEDGRLYIRSIFGEQLWVKGRIREMNLVQHRIVIEEDE